MGYGFSVEIWGDNALFSRPELHVERYSYDVITPSAARGILEAILWKPAVHYVIDRIHVVNKISQTNLRRNEVSATASASLARQAMRGSTAPLYISTKDTIQQRASLILRNVRYVIDVHFEMTDKAGSTDTPEKFYNMMLRRLRNGQCFHHPYMGCREFPAHFALWESGDVPSYYAGQEIDFGLMIYGMDYSSAGHLPASFFRAIMRNGIIDLRNCEVLR